MLTLEEMRKALEYCSREDGKCDGCPMEGNFGCLDIMLGWALDLAEEQRRQLRAAEAREAQMRERIALLGLEGMFVPKEDLVPDRKTAAALLRRCTGEELPAAGAGGPVRRRAQALERGDAGSGRLNRGLRPSAGETGRPAARAETRNGKGGDRNGQKRTEGRMDAAHGAAGVLLWAEHGEEGHDAGAPVGQEPPAGADGELDPLQRGGDRDGMPGMPAGLAGEVPLLRPV